MTTTRRGPAAPVRRRKVAGHNRRAATETPATPETSAETDTSPEVDPQSAARRPSMPAVLMVVAALFVAVGVWFLVEGRTATAGGNESLVDTGGTAEVSGQVGAALEKVFSYSYDNTAVTEKAAKDLLAGKAMTDYDKLFSQVRTQAPSQKLVLSTKVVGIGVRELTADRAHLVVFLDQAATRVDTDKTTGSAAVLTVTAERHDDIWKITTLTPR